MIGAQEALWNETTAEDVETVKDARQGGQTPVKINPKLFHDLQTALARLVSKADQLIDNVTTNLAESWMHIRCKFDGAKVINRSQSGSWEHRCMGAGLQQNLGKQWGPEIWKEMTKSPSNQIFVDTAERSALKLKCDNARKAMVEVKAKRRSSKYSQIDESVSACKAYSRHSGDILPREVDDDVTPDLLEDLKIGFYETKVRVTPEQAKAIEKQTVNQAASDQWITERRKRITASVVGGIAKMRVTSSRSKRVQQLLYNNFKGNTATRYGIQREDVACQQYITYMRHNGHSSLEVQKCGLFVSLENPWLAGTPDGLVNDPHDELSQPLGLVEIKNPYSARLMMISEAIRSRTFCLENKPDSTAYHLKKRHDYFTKYSVSCIAQTETGVILLW